jgi:hypothetical protein
LEIAFSENPVPEISPERFVEEPEVIQLPQREKGIEKVTITPSPPKKERIKKKVFIQRSLFDKIER